MVEQTIQPAAEPVAVKAATPVAAGAEVKPAKKMKWWIWAIVALVVIVVAGIILLI